MLIIEAIEKIKIDCNLSTEEVSKTIGITRAMASHYKNSNHYPSLTTAAKIKKKYGYEVEPYTSKSIDIKIQELGELC